MFWKVPRQTNASASNKWSLKLLWAYLNTQGSCPSKTLLKRIDDAMVLAIFYCVKGSITITNLCTVPVDLFSSVSCVKLYAQQHFTSFFIVYFSLTPVLVTTESISASIFPSLPSNPESRMHQNFSRQISDDDV
ncbi:hypothetical protein Tsp_12120 [Trichinella spiralis]|uniref:hypothetical protein n=1 Tax=Trichinella spiralis TaxID=6334 RepID=UPI0001EFEE40|nr:hypothetical protein Tsp_12120 [Trichinella spiralis]